jgi:eukaryotic-like serine/threonine-protein kinase
MLAPNHIHSDQVSSYELREVLGRGGQGCVYSAWDRKLQREVALKQLQLPAGDGLDAALTEARASAALKHDAFVRIHDVFQHEGAAYVAMERVNGTTLREMRINGPLPWRHVAAWIATAAEALHEAHRSGVVHGDIKPSNLIIDERDRLRILDFGVARALDPQATSPGGGTPVAGTLAYMPPELLLGQPPSPASDTYALALVFVEMTCSLDDAAWKDALPFAHHRLHADLRCPRGELPQALASLLDELLRREPGRRSAELSEIARRLRALADEYVDAATPAPRARAPRWRRPTATTARLAAVVVTVAAAAVVIALRMLTPVPEPATVLALLRQYDDPRAQEEALAGAERLLEREPKSAVAAAAAAIAYGLRHAQNASDPAWIEKAMASADRALALEDQLAIAHSAMGWALELKGRHTEAERAYRDALRLDPAEFHALNGQVSLLLRLERFDDARAALADALRRHPGEAAFLNAAGELAFRQARYEEAERWFRQAIAQRPAHALGYSNLAAALNRLGRADEALSTLQQGLLHRPDGRLYTNLGNALFDRGRYPEAATAFSHALSDAKGSPNDYLKWANFADTLRWIPGRGAEATAAYRRALDLLGPRVRPGGEPLVLSRAALYAARMQDRERAQVLLGWALASGSSTGDARMRAAITFELIGRRDEALKRLRSALDAGIPLNTVLSDPDLAGLRRDTQFQQLTMGNSR